MIALSGIARLHGMSCYCPFCKEKAISLRAQPVLIIDPAWRFEGMGLKQSWSKANVVNCELL